MSLYWISWYSGGYEDEGCVGQPPFQYWWTGQRERENYGLNAEQYDKYMSLIEDNPDEADEFLDEHSRSDGTAVALVEAETEDEIWKVVAKYFPDYEWRFCEKREAGHNPGDRFSDFENRTSLYGKEAA